MGLSREALVNSVLTIICKEVRIDIRFFQLINLLFKLDFTFFNTFPR